MARKIVTRPKAKKTTTSTPTPVKKAKTFATHQGFAQTAARTGKNLSPVVLDRIPNSFTDRDRAFLQSLHAQFGNKQFQRLNFDAGLMSRLIGHGCIEHKSGNLDERTATFQITKKAAEERLKSA